MPILICSETSQNIHGIKDASAEFTQNELKQTSIYLNSQTINQLTLESIEAFFRKNPDKLKLFIQRIIDEEYEEEKTAALDTQIDPSDAE